MRERMVFAFLLLGIGIVGLFPEYGSANSEDRVRDAIVRSQHLGAHGLGYNRDSLVTLSKALTPGDVPAILRLFTTASRLQTGVTFALASQCGASIAPLVEAVSQNEFPLSLMSDAREALRHLSEFERCTDTDREQARAAMVQIDRMEQDRIDHLIRSARKHRGEDARIESNALKLLNPEQARDVTLEECIEVVMHSRAAMRGETSRKPRSKSVDDTLSRNAIQSCYDRDRKKSRGQSVTD
ncbi:hypothetical protein [Petrachloros mirabilis]